VAGLQPRRDNARERAATCRGARKRVACVAIGVLGYPNDLFPACGNRRASRRRWQNTANVGAWTPVYNGALLHGAQNNSITSTNNDRTQFAQAAHRARQDVISVLPT